VCFNGTKAEETFRKFVLGKLGPLGDLAYYLLPSTSPARASMSPAEKLAAWRAVLAAR
jgi:TDG/mug DNA glycosylase family protein